ncbi:MAG: hypothetical protein C0453_08515, partial [Comamonadaceae bacterium]|nr:hypothetical protein [Comamonadaceae bacterium]
QVIDNEYETVCFEAFPFHTVFQSDAKVEIKGIDGQPRRSVTAWISTSAQGGRATINGTPSDHTLVYRAYVRKNVESYQRNAYTLIVFASLMMGLLVMATYHRRQN